MWLLDEFPHRFRIDAAFLHVPGPPHANASSLGEGEIHELVRDVIVSRRHDDVAWLEIKRGERLGKRGGRTPNHRYVPRTRADQAGDVLVGRADGASGCLGGFITSAKRLALEMTRHRVHHGSGHERGAGVVQVHPVRATRGVSSPLGYGFVHRILLASKLAPDQPRGFLAKEASIDP